MGIERLQAQQGITAEISLRKFEADRRLHFKRGVMQP